MRRIDSWEFAEWLALYQIDPWGDDWRQAGTVASVTANAHRRRGGRRSDPDDFVPYGIKPDKPPQSEQQITRELDLIARQFNHLVEKRGPDGNPDRTADRQHRT